MLLHLKGDAVVVFCESDLPYLKVFKRGFEHCFILIRKGQGCLMIEYLLDFTNIAYFSVSLEELVGRLKKEDVTYVPVKVPEGLYEIGRPLGRCVQVVKGILGIDKLFVITPYQLYKHLKRRRIC